jgi:hypothetical protein
MREYTFVSRARASHTIGQAWLTVPTRVPCSGGAEVDGVVVDGAVETPAFLPAGEHELGVRFDRGGNETRLDLVVDLETEDGLCVRAPALSQVIVMEPARRPFVVISATVDGNTDLHGLRDVTGLQLGAALWAGPVLVTGLAGIGVAVCNEATCGREDKNNLRNALAFPASVDAKVLLTSFSHGVATSLISVGARYSFVHAELPALTGDRPLTAHGLQGYLSWGFADRMGESMRHAERGAVYELTIPVGVLMDTGAASGGVVVTAGIGTRFFFPM